MKNLFSALTEEQLNSLTKEERNQLFQIDQKLFPDEGTNMDWLKSKLQRMKQEEEESERYAKEMEASFQ